MLTSAIYSTILLWRDSQLFHRFVILKRHCLRFFTDFALPLKSNLHGISRPPCGRSTECRLLPVTSQHMLPPLLKKSEQTLKKFLGKCPIIVPFFVTATVWRSLVLVGSLALQNFSNNCYPDVSIDVVASNTTVCPIVLHSHVHVARTCVEHAHSQARADLPRRACAAYKRKPKNCS